MSAEPQPSGQSLDWDARTYHQVSDPHHLWAASILERLQPRGDEVALDAGCGSGRVTRLLLERLPHGRVYGVDRSPAMLTVAREQLGSFGSRVSLIEADLTAVALPEPVDCVFSNATFHWVLDHDALFANLARNMRPGARISAQCGGYRNIARTMRHIEAAFARPPFAGVAAAPEQPWNFATAEETRARLEAAGFTGVETWLEDAPSVMEDREAYATYLRTVILGPYFAVLPEALHDDLVEAVVREDERDGSRRLIDYVRLNLVATRR